MLILLHSRQILSSSYAFGFFIPDSEKHKKDYEILQVGTHTRYHFPSKWQPYVQNQINNEMKCHGYNM